MPTAFRCSVRSAFGSFQRNYAFLERANALVEIAGRRLHDYHHGSRVAPILTAELLKPFESSLDLIKSSFDLIEPFLDRGSKRGNILANRDPNVGRYVDRFISH